jgi:hypothetical protein
MEDDDKDVTDIPFMTPDEVRKFLRGPSRAVTSDQWKAEFNLAVAEVTRRQTNEQIRLIRAQERQLEAQGKQIATQSNLTRSLKRASWVLAVATILLAVATLIPWIWPRH